MTLVLGKYLLVLGREELRCYNLDSFVETEGVAIQPIASYDFPMSDLIVSVPIIDTTLDEREHVDESQKSISFAVLLDSSSHIKM
jgi:hypothetical protein